MEILKIKKCCASCQHKQVNYDGSRICMLTHQKVSCQMTCERWVLAEKLKGVTLGRGMVKRYEYLMFVIGIRVMEQDAIDNGTLQPDEVATLDSLRERFETNNGVSPFVIR